MNTPQPDIVTAILAGGRGRRLGGSVKATLVVAGHPLLARVLHILAPQSAAAILCVALRYADAAWVTGAGLPIAVDEVADGGPLAGIAAALTWTRSSMPQIRGVVTSPVDVPFLPRDLVMRLAQAAPDGGIAVAESNGQRHHAIAYWPTTLADELSAFVLGGGDGAIHRWQARRDVSAVHWDALAYDPFFNINTKDDLRAAADVAVLANRSPS